jgi:hypothetical protein
MVSGLTNFISLRTVSAYIPSSNHQRILLAGVGLLFLTALPFLQPLAKKVWDVVWQNSKPKEPATTTAVPKVNIPTPPVQPQHNTGPATSTLQAPTCALNATSARPPFCPFAFTKLRDRTGQWLTLDINSAAVTMLDVVSQACVQVADKNPQYRNLSYYDDVYLILGGRRWNTPANEYIPFVDLYQQEKIQDVNTVHLVVHQQPDDKVIDLTHALSQHKTKISKVLEGLDWNVHSREILHQFRAQLHAYCSRIYRGRTDTGSSAALQCLQEIFIGIVQTTDNSNVKNYFNGLLAGVSNIFAIFQTSLEALCKAVETRIWLLQAPESPSNSAEASMRVRSTTYQFCIDQVAKHSAYVDAMRGFGDIVAQQDGCDLLHHKPAEVSETALHKAMEYLCGQDIQGYLQGHPLELSRAALFLGIPRLILMCEFKLIQAVMVDHIQQKDLKGLGISFERTRLEMPHLHKAFDMKGWLE